jgi:hypothetical protein
VFESFLYLKGNGALDWGPVSRLQGRDGSRGLVSAGRTVESTVRHVDGEQIGVRTVGLDGRTDTAAGREPAA